LGQGRLRHQVGGTAGVPSAPEMLCTPRQFRLVPKGDMRELRHLILHGLV
jgi:hypothetical protein